MMAKKPEAQKADVARAIDTYHALFLDRFGFKPAISGGKDGTLLKRMIATWGYATVESLLHEFFQTTDARVSRSDYTVGAFSALAQHLLLKRQEVGTHHKNTAENIDAAARATGRQRS